VVPLGPSTGYRPFGSGDLAREEYAMATRDLVLVGGGGLTREVVGLLAALDSARPGTSWRLRGVLDDDPARAGSLIAGVPVLGPLEAAADLPPTVALALCTGSARNPGSRLTVAARLGLPQVLCPGAVAILVYGPPESIPPPYKGRKYIPHSPLITDVRLTGEEQVAVAREIARRLHGARGPITFMIPRKGFDSYSAEGAGFWDPEADAAFVETLKAELPPEVRVVERDLDINHPAFAAEAARRLIEAMRQMEPQMNADKTRE
jgi:hypothetical protein